MSKRQARSVSILSKPFSRAPAHLQGADAKPGQTWPNLAKPMDEQEKLWDWFESLQLTIKAVTPNLVEPGQTWPSRWTSRSCGIGPITARAADLQGGDAKPGQADGRAEVVGSVQSLHVQLTYREVTPNLAKPMNMQKKLRDRPESPQSTAELQNAESLLSMRSKHTKGSK